MSVIATARAYK